MQKERERQQTSLCPRPFTPNLVKYRKGRGQNEVCVMGKTTRQKTVQVIDNSRDCVVRGHAGAGSVERNDNDSNERKGVPEEFDLGLVSHAVESTRRREAHHATSNTMLRSSKCDAWRGSSIQSHVRDPSISPNQRDENKRKKPIG